MSPFLYEPFLLFLDEVGLLDRSHDGWIVKDPLLHQGTAAFEQDSFNLVERKCLIPTSHRSRWELDSQEQIAETPPCKRKVGWVKLWLLRIDQLRIR